MKSLVWQELHLVEVVSMRRWKAVLCMGMLLFSISACGKADIDMTEEISGAEYIENPVGEVQILGMGDMTETEQAVFEETGGEEEMPSLEITVGGRTFTAVLYDNETAGALLERLPLTLAMSELNGNEKYYYFSDGFPTDSAVPEGIHAGDLMLYGSDCLVLFYESFSTGYSYTPLGYIENPEGLSDALGSGNVEVSFAAG